MAKKKQPQKPVEYNFPTDEGTGKVKAIAFNPYDDPKGDDFADRFKAVAESKPSTLQEFIQRLDKTGREPLSARDARITKLIANLKAAEEEGFHFIYCKEGQGVPDAIEDKQFAVTGTEAEMLADNDHTQLIEDWIRDLGNDLHN
ncbi:hypothetical protein FHW36_11816 [Chitinophaga polysaccharea]|uniref:Uncharacterized protein n=1 Tax=Chitinophaga polysaccharea TaxID=1293035 RepID=A0A561P0R3_9BACT|nr:hypothetical protein [Chitinophaga polysaccharea]TWF31722.1 hypothetical protein FHW36_11816 [Chitinophaga polysaccharea]